ncbi:MAG: NAD(+) synthase [Sporomusaceae bacterium]|nr:NAD(+) synthase [Sporomusaceae bacterium]
MKIALGQMKIEPGQPDRNCRTMLSMIARAKEQQAEIIVFPELSIPGYLLGDTWEQSAYLRDCEYWGNEIIKAADTICVIFGNVAVDWQKRGDDGRVRKYNACFVAYRGRLWGQDNYPYPFRIKTLLPNYREFDDARHFYCSRKLAVEQGVSINDLLQPVRLSLNGRPLTLGCILCEDGWPDDYSVKPVQQIAAKAKPDLVVNISCSPFTRGKNNKRHRVFSQQARQAQAPLIYVNNIGLQNNGKTVYSFDGCSTVYNPCGQVTFQAGAFEETLSCVDSRLPPAGLATTADDSGIDSICKALRFSIDTFLQATGINKVVIGLSGGIDSAVSAALFASVLPAEQLLLINMPSSYNSQTTKSLAASLAARLGTWYGVVPIQQSVELTARQLGQLEIANQSGGRLSLSLSPFMLENVQARDRSSRVLAALAAAFGGGFTCNANKSESTVGYATLYGDQAGFLAPLADLWKYQVYELGRYLNETVWKAEIIPEGVFRVVPSAELSPDQAVDEGKGDPLIYPYHDYLFRAFVERWDRATPEDILSWYQSGALEQTIGCEPGLTRRLFPDAASFISDLEHWWRLYSGMAVAKRIQAPPVLAVSRRAYGFDHREAQNPPYFTAAYQSLKAALLQPPGGNHVL